MGARDSGIWRALLVPGPAGKRRDATDDEEEEGESDGVDEGVGEWLLTGCGCDDCDVVADDDAWGGC